MIPGPKLKQISRVLLQRDPEWPGWNYGTSFFGISGAGNGAKLML